jgi:hypothetical protein
MERLQHDNSSYHHVRDPFSRPLQDVAEESSLLPNRQMRKISPQDAQEAQFKTMKKPSFTTLPRSGTHASVPASVEDEVCLICLEEFTDSNPKSFFQCGHGVLPSPFFNFDVFFEAFRAPRSHDVR